MASNMQFLNDLIAAFFKVVVAFCNKITLCSLFFWIQVDF
ncbi:putative membrane protein [Escherichia coli 2865200]|nr:putative membrane protein [Escherichia coli 2865200]